ncbi:3-deoxy-manno-octulosonate cytidylyltransferase [Legionella israelensis]|uniref:3-deoxy-manno-octulosonate cytidylyltransferase n=1 Tax=Legionella israelensis TaxID=454 RepID=A0A0W0VIC9_9GAMM|nr:3-deoxy-manno-octulosonate cytidylyltransferase [Legionella israelensis]KTD19629.1 3-deoxy-manno-octulosonate cytidylyltransferase [Legionella israelensis]QBR83517.1 3-deoxy-manno-octulosonate cytidylyltransferase [Legionella israelensis]QBS09105.1 3-deoxy-manno-octulosonate cytidylyltransferase [Legionella israelensis]SCY43563.1 3-deoxy-manno-octulosonate cytidylyltransferase (CMP-KDO synthetase) [Legionella israelensis DSM 19235]STX58830.1 3-deoxy-manno-octulosonate cytidylyltransferase [
MRTPFHVVIPARYQSSRFPGKLLMDLNGVSVIERVYRQALLAQPASIIVATDHPQIVEHVRTFNAEVMMTDASHQSGTDRIAEVVAKGDYGSEDIIVNVQGDEPFIAPELIQQVARRLSLSKAPVATLCWPITSDDLMQNPNVVKVIRNKVNQALYFSRAGIPHHRDSSSSYTGAYRHIGLYAYRAAFLLDFVNWPVCELEAYEALEQLRILWQGHPMDVEEACVEPLQDINTKEDLLRAKQLLTAI